MRKGPFDGGEDPFRNRPDPRFFYPSPSSSKAYDELLSRASEHRGVVVLLGDVGSGKTTMLAKLHQDLEATGVCVARPMFGQSTVRSMWERCCLSLGLQLAATDDPERVLSEFLKSKADGGKALAFLIDEAHLLRASALRALWDLTHAGDRSDSAFSFVLAGQYDLLARLRAPELSILQEAGVERISLSPVEPNQVAFFIRHRLWATGHSGIELFTEEALEKIAAYSKGNPALINLICGLSLKFSRVLSESVVSAEAVDDTQAFLGGSGPSDSATDAGLFNLHSIERLQRLYDLVSPQGNRGDGLSSEASVGPIPSVPLPEDESLADRDLWRAISNVLEWKPLSIEEEQTEPEFAVETRPEPKRTGGGWFLKPLAVSAAMVALIAGGIALLYAPGIGPRLQSVANIEPSSDTPIAEQGNAAPEESPEEVPIGKEGADAASKLVLEKDFQPDGLLPSPDVKEGPDPIVTVRTIAPAAAARSSLTELAGRPHLEVADVSGSEGAELPLSIVVRPADESATGESVVTIAGLPEGARLSAGEVRSDGVWLLALEDLSDLMFLGTKGVHGEFLVSVTASSMLANDDTAVTSAEMALRIEEVADPPILDVADALGAEGSELPLRVSVRPASDGGSDRLTVVIEGLPEEMRLSAGELQEDGTWLLTPEDLPGLMLSAPEGIHGEFALSVFAGATVANGDVASTSEELLVSLAEVAKEPLLEVAGVAGPEGAALRLPVSAQPAEGADSGELTIEIAGLPDGASLSAGEAQSDGTWLLMPQDLPELTLLPPPRVHGELLLYVIATSTVESGDTASAVAELPLRLEELALEPVLEVANATGAEGEEVPLTLSVRTADDLGSDQLAVAIGGLPQGFGLSAGEPKADGMWLLAPEDLPRLALLGTKGAHGEFSLAVVATSTVESGDSASASADLLVSIAEVAEAPLLEVADAAGPEGSEVRLPVSVRRADDRGSDRLSAMISGLPKSTRLSAGEPQSDGTWLLAPEDLADLRLLGAEGVYGEFVLDIVASSTVESGDIASTSAELTVNIAETAEEPILEVADAAGSEGSEVLLPVTARPANEGGSDRLKVTIAGLPEGTRLSAGEPQSDGGWMLTPEDLVDLRLLTSEGSYGEFVLSVVASATVDSGDSASASREMIVSLAEVAKEPLLKVAGAAGPEGTEVPLSLSVQPADAAGSGQLTVTVAGLPEGARLSAGEAGPGGDWLLTPDDLPGLFLLAPPGLHGEFLMSAIATSTLANGDSAWTVAEFQVRLEERADPPLLEVVDAAESEGAEVPLSLSVRPADAAGSEKLAVTIAGLPEGARLSAGEPQEDGTWLLAPEDLPDLTLLVAEDVPKEFPLSAVATSTVASGDTARSAAEIMVTLLDVPEKLGGIKEDTPVLEDPSIDRLLARGRTLLELSDTASARLFFELAVEMGSPAAARLLGETYDPLKLHEAGVIGIKGDPAQAIEWYKKAISAGDERATANLTRLEDALGR